MKTLAAIWITVLFLSAAGIASSADAVTAESRVAPALRELATLPGDCVDHRMGLTLGLAYVPDEGFGFHSSAADPESIRNSRLLTVRHPKDGDAWYRLGLILQADHRPKEAAEAFAKAVSLAQSQVDQKPQDARAALRLSKSLLALGDRGRAIEILRSVVQRWPKRFHARIALGSAIGRVDSPQNRAEARQVFDEAVRTFPRRAEVYAARASFLFYRGFQDPALADLRRVGELAPCDPYALALSPWMEEAASAMRVGQGMALDRSWADLGPAVRRAVAKTMRRLDTMGADDEPTRAAKALTALGFLQYELKHDVTGSLANLRAALRRDPNRLDAREMILHIYGVEGQWWDLADYSLECARQTGRIRFLLTAAFALTQLRRLEQASDALDRALRKEPRDLALLLCRASLAVRSPDAGDVSLAAALLRRAENELPSQPHFKADFAYVRGLHLASVGQSEAARADLITALEGPNARQARKALTLLTTEQ